LLGIMDGEGCISITKHKLSYLPNGFCFRPEVVITSTKISVLQYINQFAGGRVWLLKPRNRGKNECAAHQLRFNRKELINGGLLDLFIDGLVLKSKQAEILKQYFVLSDLRRHHPNDSKMRKQIHLKKENLCRQIHKLNARGFFVGSSPP